MKEKVKKSGMAGIAASIAIISAAVLLSGRSRSMAMDGSLTAKPAPGWALQDLAGKTVHASDFKGKVVVLDFWATWCPPCRAEIPGFIDLQKKYQSQGLTVVGVSMDQDGVDTVKAFVQKMGMNYPVVMADTNVVAAYGNIEAIPTTFIIDRTGRIVNQHLGLTDKAEFEAEIKPLLNQ